MFARSRPAVKQALLEPALVVALSLIFALVLKTVDAAGATLEERDVRKQLLRALGDVITLVEPRLLELWKSTELTFSQRRLLRRLREGPRSAGTLAAGLAVHAPTLTRQLTRLEARGLISRQIDAGDRRRIVVSLTPAGRRILAGHRVLGDSVLATAARDLTPEQCTDLVAGLHALTALARRGLEDADEQR